MRFLTRPFALLVFSLLFSTVAAAHDVDVTGVARVFLDEVAINQYHLSVVDQQVPPLRSLEGVIPPRCTADERSSTGYRFSCTPALTLNDVISLPWNLEGVVIVARWGDGSSSSAFFRGNGATIDIPLVQLNAGAASLANLAGTYLILGAEHIVFGFDHLLFVFGLLLLLQGFWPLVKTITAFTLAHSITLGLAVLGYVNFPSAPVELIIAMSIILLAREIVLGQQGIKSLVHVRPWLIALIFGLFHGLGFAGALGELGLRPDDIPAALLFFNLGVEAGQLGFIAVMSLSYVLVFQRLRQFLPQIQTTLAYGLGAIATYWFIERLPGMLPA